MIYQLPRRRRPSIGFGRVLAGTAAPEKGGRGPGKSYDFACSRDHKHAIQQTFFLYVYEPGGNGVEVANTGTRLILAPDRKPIAWTDEGRKKGQAWGLKTIESFHTHGARPVEGDEPFTPC